MPAQHPHHPDREALRAVIVDALGDLGEGSDPRRSAEEVMRALDAYIDSSPEGQPTEAPAGQEVGVPSGRAVLWAVLGCGAIATVVTGIAMQGNPFAGVVILAIWVAVIVVLVST